MATKSFETLVSNSKHFWWKHLLSQAYGDSPENVIHYRETLRFIAELSIRVSLPPPCLSINPSVWVLKCRWPKARGYVCLTWSTDGINHWFDLEMDNWRKIRDTQKKLIQNYLFHKINFWCKSLKNVLFSACYHIKQSYGKQTKTCWRTEQHITLSSFQWELCGSLCLSVVSQSHDS